MDPAAGIIGAVVIASWSISLIRSSGMTLLDMVPDPSLSSRIKEWLEVNGDRVSDLHIWRVGPGHMALVASVVTDEPQDPSIYKARLRGLPRFGRAKMNVFSVRAAELVADRPELTAAVEPLLKALRLSNGRLRTSTAR